MPIFLRQVSEALLLMPGLTQLTKKLQSLAWHVAIPSGGFTYFAELLRDKLCLVSIAANELEIRDGRLIGEVRGRGGWIPATRRGSWRAWRTSWLSPIKPDGSD